MAIIVAVYEQCEFGIDIVVASWREWRQREDEDVHEVRRMQKRRAGSKEPI